MTSIPYLHSMPAELYEAVGDDREVFIELYEIFLREGFSKLDELKIAAQEADLAKLGRLSHSLKGVVGPLGADALVEILQTIEIECDRQQCVCDAARVAGIDAEMHCVRDELERFIAGI